MPPTRRSAKSNKTNISSSSSSSSSSALGVPSSSSANSSAPPLDETTILRNALQETERKAIILEGQLAVKEEEYTKLFRDTTQLDERLKQYSSRVNDIEEGERLKSTIKDKEDEIRRLKMEHINCDIDRCNQLLLIVDNKKEDQVMIGNQFSNPDSDLFLLHRKELLDELKSLKETNNQLNQQLKSSDEELSNQIAINISTQDQIDDLIVVKKQYEDLKVKYEDLQKRKSKSQSNHQDEGSKKMKKELVFANNRNTELNERLTKMEEEKMKIEEENENLKEEIAKLKEKVDSHENEGNKDAISDTDDGSKVESKEKKEEGEPGAVVAESKDRKGKKRASETGGSDKDSKRSKAGSGGEAKSKGRI
ncbi:hypothetical protein V865_000459 [Kwoniella europaea PYCC6329]|uniref:Uncharacterized protein n=1 Tax=Kwoniella europaea PYCC6329 TaxID=1423913 RepID=A0AAX4K7T6_9TREE